MTEAGSSPENDPGGADASVLRRTLLIVNKRGLHARAAAKFVTLAERFGASVDVEKDGQSVSARSIMGLMMLGAGKGATIVLRAEGWDAKEAMEALSALVEAGFHEQD
jgi:phosphocarrier protein